MKNNESLHSSFLDILFRGRNKTYGAYQLRKFYYKRLTLSFLPLYLIFILGILFFSLNFRKIETLKQTPVFIREVKLQEVKIEEIQKLPPPAPPLLSELKKIPKQATAKFTPPKVVPDNKVSSKETPPKQQDLTNQIIGTENIKGDKDPNSTSSLTLDEGQGQIGNGQDGPLSRVDVEARYPGNWHEFLKDVIQYPEEAIDEGIHGSVLIRFVVDTDGTVSNVTAISGPKELRREAERAIKKAGSGFLRNKAEIR